MKAKTKRKPRKPSQLDTLLMADQIESVSTFMWWLAEQMDDYGMNRNDEILHHAREMAVASQTMKSWVSALRKEASK